MVGEMVGPILLSLHNLAFYQRLMAQARQAIREDNFDDWARTKVLSDSDLYQFCETNPNETDEI